MQGIRALAAEAPRLGREGFGADGLGWFPSGLVLKLEVGDQQAVIPAFRG